jgi:nitroreductase
VPTQTRTTDLVTALRTTASTRAFTDRPVTRTELHRILEFARFAPSGGNQQPWRVVSVEDRATRSALGTLITETSREYVALSAAGARPFGLTAAGRWPGPGEVDLAAARTDGPTVDAFATLSEAPALLAVLVRLASLAAMDAELDRHGLCGGASIYPFCWNVLLAARLEGLGGVLTTFAVRREPEVLALLGAPEGWAVAAVLALGEPVHQPERLRRDPVEDFAVIDRFDGPSLRP